MVLYVYFFAYFVTFRKHFYYLLSQNVNNEKKNWAQREVLKTERQTRHLLQQMTRLPLLFY